MRNRKSGKRSQQQRQLAVEAEFDIMVTYADGRRCFLSSAHPDNVLASMLLDAIRDGFQNISRLTAAESAEVVQQNDSKSVHPDTEVN